MSRSVSVPIGREISLDFRRGISGAVIAATAGGTRVKEDGDRCGAQRRRRAALRMVDRQLAKGNFKLALSLVKQLQRQPPPAGLRGFAAARQVPRRVSSVEELNLRVTETSVIRSLFDPILDSIKSSLQSSQLEESSVSGEGDDLYPEDDIVEHKFSSTEDVKQDKIADASVQFIGFDFLTQANKRKLSSTVLSKFLCVIVGGLVVEHLVFGHSKGHHADVEKLDRVLKWSQFTKDEANTLSRWAVLNTLIGGSMPGQAQAIARGGFWGNNWALRFWALLGSETLGQVEIRLFLLDVIELY